MYTVESFKEGIKYTELIICICALGSLISDGHFIILFNIPYINQVFQCESKKLRLR